QMAANVLAAEMAAKAGDMASAERLLRAASAGQDTHWFTEPPPWYFPVRQSLGAVLLQAGRPADAEVVYREDLRRNPGNGGGLCGGARGGVPACPSMRRGSGRGWSARGSTGLADLVGKLPRARRVHRTEAIQNLP